MRRTGHRSFHGPRWTFLLLLVVTGLANGGLTGLVHDIDDDSIRIAFIDSADGSVSLGTASIKECCYLGAGLSAVDSDQGRVFALGTPTSGPNSGDPVLMTLGMDGESAFSISLGEIPKSVLAWDSQSEQLISVVTAVSPARTQWITIDPLDGSVDALGDASADCCELIPGMADVGDIPDNGRGLFTIGRPFGASEWLLLVVDLASGEIDNLATLPPGRPGFLVFDDESGQIDVLIQTSLDDASLLFRINPADGSVTEQAVNSTENCCLTSPGDMASQSKGVTGATWWVGGKDVNGTPTPGFFTLSATDSNALSNRVSLDGNLFLHALIVSGSVVDPGLLFQDRFEP